MALLSGKREVEVEIKSAAEKFYKIFRGDAQKIPNICPENFHAIEVHEGDWVTVGSVKHWSYTLEGKKLAVKETVEAIDEENMSFTFKLLEGDIMKQYKSFKNTMKATKKEGGGGLVKWTFEYEKLNEGIPDPDVYLGFFTKATQDIDAHLLKAI